MRHSLTAVVLFTAASSASAAVYNYGDTTFLNANWNAAIIANTSAPLGSFTAGQANAGGSPILPGIPTPPTPDYRTVSHTFGGGGAIVVGHKGVNFNWTPLPLESAVSVNYSYDLIFRDANADGASGAIGFAPAIFQGGNVYRGAFDNVFFQTGWNRFSATNLPITSFQQVDPATALTLPFSPNPLAAMGFGYVSANSANQVNVSKFGGTDDFALTLNTLIVPEPTTLSALAAVSLITRRRR